MIGSRPLLIAHRGGASHEIHNSSAAFEYALKLDVDMLEFDVRQAGDGMLVLLHDPVVYANGHRWVVQDTPSGRLRQFLPLLLTLDEYLERFGHSLPFNLDMKTHGYEVEVVDALRRHGAIDQALISSGHILSLRRLAGLCPELNLGLSRGHARTTIEIDAVFSAFDRYMVFTLPIMLSLAKAHAVMLHHDSVSRRLVDTLHEAGFRVFSWTVDDADTATELARIGVDGITSNHPTLISQALDRLAAV